ncbi:MAG: shikimate dehydrogenase [Rhizobiaceae bacterium]|nr:shikimate dehydrogenase [Rhizobiaceae bacterium]
MKNAPKNAFVTGFPIKQSKSPLIHGYWLNDLHIDGTYRAVELAEDGFSEFIAKLKNGDADFEGGNVTMPFKEEAFQLVDERDAIAEKIGAVNTIYRKDGKLCGTNTDAYGFAANLDDLVPQWRPEAKNTSKAVVFGAGGASRAILYALIEAGFSEVALYNRTLSRAETLAGEFGLRVTAYQIDDVDHGLKNADLFVNTSSLGMHGTPVPDLNFASMAEGAIATDIVYHPLKTKFLENAEKQGIAIADGFGMLLHQAVPGFEHWFGARPKVTKTLRDKILNG